MLESPDSLIDVAPAALELSVKPDLVNLPARKLLDKFGSGRHAPGSGSAAALSGMLAGRLIITVSKLTLQKQRYASAHSQMEFVLHEVESRHEPELYRLFQRDAEVFDEVIVTRRLRDKETDDQRRKQLRATELDHLKVATNLPIEIAHHCIALGRLAGIVFDFGFKSARGDSGAAASTATAGASAALCVAYLNLKQFRDSRWARETRERCDLMLADSQGIQRELFAQVTSLRRDLIDQQELELNLGFE